MSIEKVQEAQGITEWVVRDFEGDLAAARFLAVKPGDLVSVFSIDGTFNAVLILPDGTNMISSTAY
jgi:hypothetical protein